MNVTLSIKSNKQRLVQMQLLWYLRRTKSGKVPFIFHNIEVSYFYLSHSNFSYSHTTDGT